MSTAHPGRPAPAGPPAGPGRSRTPGAPLPGRLPQPTGRPAAGIPSPALRAALERADTDRLVLDLDGIAGAHDALLRALPGATDVRFAVKACPVDPVLDRLAAHGAGFDAASPAEITRALRAGAPVDRVHYGNTIKSDEQIAAAHRLGIREYATDSVEDVTALGRHAPGARVFCRLATSGQGALWGLSRKFGCSARDAVTVMERARAAGLVPAGLSVHVGSQQLTVSAWREALDRITDVLLALDRRGIHLDHVNLGGGLPALGYLDRAGRPLDPPLTGMLEEIRTGVARLRTRAGRPLRLVLEPGRHLVADHGAIRARVARLSTRQGPDGRDRHWLYLSCGKFNGLYEMDAVRHRLHFPTHPAGPGTPTVPAVIAGPTCDSDDAYAQDGLPTRVPAALASGDPVWILSTGAYATSYATEGFNGFDPLPVHFTALPVGAAR
ncbi:type III PLP-dependent enzyme (plasmid) [Streptomyces sp. BI20]|uniref:type III PLP-dependent enzyme n=1 Tax=Streptomyces sp. BI20 TaxID=3403460 RepID=UPI003C71F058